MIGRLIDGRYQVKSRIARGGMATVYLATDLRLERRVAVKIMHGHLADDSAFKAAAAGAEWNKSFYQILTNQAGKDSWPITGATFILMHKVQDKPENASAVLKFFDWSYKNGDKVADDLDYVPMPPSVKDAIRKSWAQIKDASGKAVAY